VATVAVGDRYRAAFGALEREGALPGPAWLGSLRRAAIARVAETGFPTTRDEDWRYTNLAPLAAAEFPLARARHSGDATLAVPAPLGAGVWARLVFVDGRYAAKHSTLPALPGRMRVTSLAEAMITDGETVEHHLSRHAGHTADVFAALSTAFLQDGAFVHVPDDIVAPAPIELLFLATTPGALSQPRTLVVTGEHSRVAVVERHVGLVEQAYFANAVSEIVVGRGASLDHHVLQEQGPAAFHLATVRAVLGRDAAFSTCAASFGGRLARTMLGVRFDGEGARAALRGVYVMGGTQHVDHHVSVDHAVPRCASEQLYKGVLDGAARAVFSGRILVRRDAQKTDATQTNKHLLLSDGVEVDSKPHLEIFADDVRCTHGAAEGQLAPEAMFYLRSRGLAESEARALLTYGFAREVVERVAVEPVQAHLDRVLRARLGPGETA
jgi:Fe-S cluster assembly protein SufD